MDRGDALHPGLTGSTSPSTEAGWGAPGIETTKTLYRLGYVRGPEGIIVMLPERLG